MMGLGLSVAFRARVWNIGGEGQYYIGALVGGAIGLTFGDWPRPLLIVAMLAGGVAGGLLWALLAGLMKVRRGVSEIISTLMLNYIAILFVQYMARGPLQEPGGYLPESAQLVAAARLPALTGRIHLGVVIAVLLIPLVYALVWSTPLGFRLRAVGERASVARYAGIKVEKMILFALAFSGALGGLAGIIEVSTLHTRLKGEISGGYGFSGILVALLGRMHPAGVAVAALFFAALTIGAQSMHVVYGLSDALANAIQAVVVLSVLAVDALARRGQ
jgi:simple sugar transport system permease protein